VIGSAVAQGDVERRRRPAILRFRDQPHVRKLREHPDCVVGRGTVDYNNLVRLPVLREHARNRIGEKSRLFQNEDDHRNGRTSAARSILDRRSHLGQARHLFIRAIFSDRPGFSNLRRMFLRGPFARTRECSLPLVDPFREVCGDSSTSARAPG